MANKNEKDFALIWCALNVEMNPIDIMRFVEKIVGRRVVSKQYAALFDLNDSTLEAIRAEMAQANKARTRRLAGGRSKRTSSAASRR